MIYNFKRHYIDGFTPIQKMARLSASLGGPDIYIKRDDMTGGLGEGGNKVRKMEFLMADALQEECDTLITCGAVQSNHCMTTLAAAVKEGLKCRLVLEERVPNSYRPEAGGNNLLYHLLGAENIRVVPGDSDMMAEMETERDQLMAEGRKPYIIPGGGSNEIGTLGYVSCAGEIVTQVKELGISPDYVITASGSGGTHAGLLAGFHASKTPYPVLGISVRANQSEQEEKILRLAGSTLEFMGVEEPLSSTRVTCFDHYVGGGYSIPTEEMKEAIQMVASLEGIFLDPVYSGKAMAGLIDLCRKNYFEESDKVLFIHTGGFPALFEYTKLFLG